MLKRITNYFKVLFGIKPKLSYDPLNILISDIYVGWVFDYDGKSWEVIQLIEFDYGNSEYAMEAKITDGRNIKFLFMEEYNGETRVFATDRINITDIGETLPQTIIDNNDAPTSINYNGIEYIGYSSTPCYADDIDSELEATEIYAYEYADAAGENYLRIEQHTETTFDVVVGPLAKTYMFTNITPVAAE